MDLVKLSITGGLALAATLSLASTAHHSHADPLLQVAIARGDDPIASPVILTASPDASPIFGLGNDTLYGAISLFPATSASTRAVNIDGRRNDGSGAWDAYIDEASRRFGVPASWVRSVMRAESAGHQFIDGRPITSSAGAMGLMQVMPATYAELRARYGFGPDPYDPHDNVLAGTAYIREMYDRFGAPGFLAAYNAGPGRVGDYLARGRTLPNETRRYLAATTPTVIEADGDTANGPAVSTQAAVRDLTGMRLTSASARPQSIAPRSPEIAPLFVRNVRTGSTVAPPPSPPAGDRLFVVLGTADRHPDRAIPDTGGN